MKKISSLLAIVFTLISVQQVMAQEPFEDPTLVQGAPWRPPVLAFAEEAVGDECDYLPRWVDNLGGAQMPPGWPESGDMAEILDWTGLEVDRSLGCERARPGEAYMSLEAIEGRCGAAAVIARADDENGQPLDGVLLFMNWPSMGDANQFPAGGVDPPYFSEGVGGWTDGGGAVGWGYGGGSFIKPGVGGPFSVWGSSCTHSECRYGQWVGFDALKRTGWFGGTEHCTLNPWFEPRVKQGGEDPPPTGEEYLANVDATGRITGHIPFIPGPPASGTLSLVWVREGEQVAHVPWQAR